MITKEWLINLLSQKGYKLTDENKADQLINNYYYYIEQSHDEEYTPEKFVDEIIEIEIQRRSGLLQLIFLDKYKGDAGKC
jgi:hypothetical protein